MIEWTDVFNQKNLSKIEKKTLISSLRIETAIKDFGIDKCAVACSFGKDSMAVLHLALSIAPEINVVWCDTNM